MLHSPTLLVCFDEKRLFARPMKDFGTNTELRQGKTLVRLLLFHSLCHTCQGFEKSPAPAQLFGFA